MAEKKYDRPPIIEAIIELRFKSSASPRSLERLRNKFKSSFPGVEERRSVDVSVGPSGADAKTEVEGYIMRAHDGADVVIVQRHSFGMARNAPYEGWDTLLEKTKKNFDTYRAIARPRTLERIATRFVNRIDIPRSAIIDGNLGAFVRFGFQLPKQVAPKYSFFSGEIITREATTERKVRIVGGLASPALLDHTSINLDIDAFDDEDLPSKLDEVWARFEPLHQAKNAIFEACITDQARALFS